MGLSYLQNIPIYYPSGKYKLSIRSFLEYYYTTIIFVHDISHLSKRFLVGDANV